VSAPSSNQLIEVLDKRLEVSSLPRLELCEYRALIERIPRPTDDQIRQFASYVAEAKSWYKHLPLFPPGGSFHFFVDPCAGLDRILRQDSQVIYVQRTSNTPQFHYTWMTTVAYRSRFSRLSFACDAGTDLFLPVFCRLHDGRDISGFLANNPSRASVHVSEDREFRLPQEVLEAGTIQMTGVIHPLTARPWVWLKRLADDTQLPSWPEETGGADTAREIVDRCQVVEAKIRHSISAATQGRDAVDEDLNRLLAPERQRLHELMVVAMHRVVALLYPNAV
jgi:hypothetical protein